METRIEVKGMTCGHCVSAVEKALAAVEGVEKVVEVSKDNDLAVVSGEADPQSLLAAIKEEGYEARIL